MNREIDDPRIREWIDSDQKKRFETTRRVIQAMGEDISPVDWFPNWDWATNLPELRRYEVPEAFLEVVGVSKELGNRCWRNAKVEIIGFPDSGKSTIGKWVTKLTDNRLDYLEEFVCSVWKPERQPGVKLSQVANAVEEIKVDSRERFYERLKLIYSSEALRSRFIPPVNDEDTFKHLLMARGVNDLLISFRRPWVGYTDKEIVRYLSRISEMIEPVDAVIVVGVTYSTAVERRKAAGKKGNSKEVNSIKWPTIDEGLSWWLKKAYPIMREEYGTGLLVLNAEDSFDHNVARALVFLGQVMNQCEGI